MQNSRENGIVAMITTTDRMVRRTEQMPESSSPEHNEPSVVTQWIPWETSEPSVDLLSDGDLSYIGMISSFCPVEDIVGQVCGEVVFDSE